MEHRKLVALASTLLLCLLGFGQAAFAADATSEGGTLQQSLEAGMDTPQARFLAIAPIFAQAATNPGEYSATRLLEDRTLFKGRARELGVAEERLELWHDLFLNNGRPGLSSLQEVDFRDFVMAQTGTWVLTSRHFEGQFVRASSVWQWELLSMSDTRAELRALLIEEGILETFLKLGPADGSTYRLGQFTNVTIELVRSGQRDGYAERNGFESWENAVRVTQRGELLGYNYPGNHEKILDLEVDALFVKQGDVYNQVRMEVLVNGGDRSTYQGGQVLPMPGHAAMVMHALHFDGQEIYQQIDGDTLMRHLDRYWELAKGDPWKYLNPRMMLDDVNLNNARKQVHDGVDTMARAKPPQGEEASPAAGAPKKK